MNTKSTFTLDEDGFPVLQSVVDSGIPITTIPIEPTNNTISTEATIAALTEACLVEMRPKLQQLITEIVTKNTLK